ncbi:hypothetical protein LJ038_004907 [Salmonella enterica]|nr:hypothetical protein [Salmonella enterica]
MTEEEIKLIRNLETIEEGLKSIPPRWFLSETLDDVDSLKDLKEEVFK